MNDFPTLVIQLSLNHRIAAFTPTARRSPPSRARMTRFYPVRKCCPRVPEMVKEVDVLWSWQARVILAPHAAHKGSVLDPHIHPGGKGSSLPIPASPRELIASNLDTIFNSLKLAGGMVQNVPYIGLVADIMLQILQIRDVSIVEFLDGYVLTVYQEVTVFKDKWKDVMNDIKKMRSIVKDYAQTSAQPDGSPSLVLSEDVQGHLRDLERLLEDIAQALSRCCPKRKADQLRIILQRRELRSLVDGCKAQLQTELAFFNDQSVEQPYPAKYSL
ncbi:hypothetical protein EWM64_g2595 [Hericium alpestre]|uniref:Uncharacterized protein n=1 Tax=Hericium alpestre TaxID=135208 RepID=A0A4Z0A506_9AGAM|nr:hypothetical protein EWM64_g2595 [Hericium alpestre]